MVNEFNQYARVPQLELHQLELNKLVREVLSLYDNARAVLDVGHAVDIKSTFASELPLIKGDPAQLRQILHNLLQNAQDALVNTADPMIEVRTEVTQEGVQLTITDNGCGFPDEIKARVFEPYVTTKSKGTGLGLPIVKKIVEEHGAIIRVENGKVRGAKISIVFPLLEGA